MEHRKVDITTICGGLVQERFTEAFQEIVDNIDDPSTDPKKPRRITMVFDFIPDGQRSQVGIKFGCTTKPVSATHIESHMFLAREAGKVAAYTTDIRQGELYDQIVSGQMKPILLKKDAASS